jgi:hypothetical protein
VTKIDFLKRRSAKVQIIPLEYLVNPYAVRVEYITKASQKLEGGSVVFNSLSKNVVA